MYKVIYVVSTSYCKVELMRTYVRTYEDRECLEEGGRGGCDRRPRVKGVGGWGEGGGKVRKVGMNERYKMRKGCYGGSQKFGEKSYYGWKIVMAE